MIFEEKMGTQQVARNCFRTPIPKYHSLMLLFGLAHGSENFDCYPKRVLKNFYTNLLSLRQGGMSSFGLIETKNEKKVKQKLFSLHQVKNQFGHFGGPNPIFFFFLKIVL